MLYWFSTYLNGKERKLDGLVSKLKLGSQTNYKLRKDIVDFYLKNPVETYIWFEYKYKGYSFLKKRKRKLIYKTRDKIKEEFLFWYEENKLKFKHLDQKLPNNKLSLDEKKKLWVLVLIDKFLNGKYFYKESSAFWKLFPLKYDKVARLIGDCNQIVSFYIWLYGLVEDDVSELKIKLLPNHVCLHMYGYDFEATDGHFVNFRDKGEVLDAENIVAVNLLDIADPVEKRWDVNAVNTAKMHLIASLFDVDDELVQKNLKITYSNLGIFYLNQKNWGKARHFFEVAQDEEKIRYTYINEALFLVDLKRFVKALKVAKKTKDLDFEKQIAQSYFGYLMKMKKWKESRKIANKFLDSEHVRYTYQNEFAELYNNLSEVKTVKQAKLKKSKYERLLYLAKKTKNTEAENKIRNILKSL